jgi:hypothetical protein
MVVDAASSTQEKHIQYELQAERRGRRRRVIFAYSHLLLPQY